MSRWTNEEVFESYANLFGDRVRWQRNIPFSGQVGHYYFLRRRRRQISFEVMARITRLSGDAEVTLLRINSAYIIHIGNPRVATATVQIPRRQDGIEEFEWIAHTHPLDQEDQYQRIARGPTQTDRNTLNIIFGRWGQMESTVVVCRRGQVVETVTFRAGRDEFSTGERVWTPDSD